MSETTPTSLILWFFISLFLVSGYLLGRLFWPFISIIVIAAVVAGAFRPVYRLLIIKDKITPAFSSLLTCIIIFLVLFVPIAFFVGVLSKQAYDLYLAAKDAALAQQLQDLIEGNVWIEKITALLARFHIQLSGEDIKSLISQLAKTVGFFLYEQARSIASNMLLFVINFFLMLLVVFYLLIDGKRLIDFIMDISPLPRQQNEQLAQKFKEMAGAILIGNGVVGLTQGVLGGMVFALFGFNSPFLWGVIMAILSFLPFVGIGQVFIPAAIFLFLKSRISAGILLLVLYAVLAGGVEYVLKTKLVGRQVQMHTLLVFFSVVGGLKLFGILGVVYGPLVVTGFLALADIYRTHYQKLVES